MFTGLIEFSAQVVVVTDHDKGRLLGVMTDLRDVKLGDSISINGACLTVTRFISGHISFEIIKETLGKTNLGQLQCGYGVHFERAMRAGDRFDGHFVQGHVDGTAKLLSRKTRGGDWRLRIEAPPAIAKYLAPQGSITVDGVSLTIASLDADSFEVALIPTTREITCLGNRRIGYDFNIECDMIAKTVVRYLQLRL